MKTIEYVCELVQSDKKFKESLTKAMLIEKKLMLGYNSWFADQMQQQDILSDLTVCAHNYHDLTDFFVPGTRYKITFEEIKETIQ